MDNWDINVLINHCLFSSRTRNEFEYRPVNVTEGNEISKKNKNTR